MPPVQPPARDARYGAVIAALRDRHHCPNCGRVVTSPRCEGCGVDLAGDGARLLLQHSEEAAQALDARNQALRALVDAVPAGSLRSVPVSVPAGAQPTGPVTQQPVVRPLPAAPARPRTPVNQVAVFSAVGVGALVAAAMVFAWLVPLDAWVVRGVLLGVTAVAAAAAVWLRARRPVSAAAVGVGVVALGLLDVNLLTGLVSPANRWFFAAAGVGVLAIALAAAGFLLRLRPWVSAAVLLAPLAVLLVVPGLLQTDDSTLWPSAGVLFGAAAVAAAGRPAARLWQAEGGQLPLVVERRLLGLVAALALLGAAGATALMTSTERGAWGGLVLLGCAVAAWLHSADGNDGWRTAAGVAAVLAAPATVASLGRADTAWLAAGWGAWLLLAGLSLLPALASRRRLAGALRGGFWTALLLSGPAALLVIGAAVDAASTVALGFASGAEPLTTEWHLQEAVWAVAAVAAGALGLLVASRFDDGHAGPLLPRTGRGLWAWVALAGCGGAVLLPFLNAPGQVWLLVALAAGCGSTVWWASRRGTGLTGAVRAAHDYGGQLVLAGAVFLAWADQLLTLTVGAAGVLLGVAWKLFVNRTGRFWAIGLAYAYALVLLGVGLWWYPPTGSPPDEFMVVGLSAVAASVVAVAAAVVPRVPERYWYAVLAVSCLPWVASIALDLRDRTWWTAAAAASLLVVEVLVFTTGRRQVPAWLRISVAAGFLPTLAVVIINVGAMLISTSGSPLLLPIVAAAASVVAVAAAPWRRALTAGGMAKALAGQVRVALEASALASALAAVTLSIVLEATGPDTTLLVCALLAVGAVVVALQPDRRWAWALAGLAFAGVLWSALVLWDVTLVEWYTLPVGLGTLAAALLLAWRSPGWWPLVAAGLHLSLWPTLVLALSGSDVVARTAGLTAAALVLAAASWWLRARAGSSRRLLAVTGSGIAVAGIAPVVLSAWMGRMVFGGAPGKGNEWLTQAVAGLAASADQVFFTVVGIAAASVLFYAWAGQVVHWAAGSTRWRRLTASWRFAPALAVAAAVLVITIALGAPGLPSPTEFTLPLFGWPVVVAMWLACLGFLGLTVWATLLRLRGRVLLPPAWACWVAAMVVGIAGWSLRLLRVEFHALPLGLVLFGCGLLVLLDATRHPDRDSGDRDRGRFRVPAAWPNGFTDSRVLLVPGTVATLAPSTLAIWTDPQTWRAILVLVMALGFLLVGARRLWQSVMVAGIVDLALAILLVFVARRGSIDWVPWLLALVGAGGMLLGLAIYAERRQHVGAAVTNE